MNINSQNVKEASAKLLVVLLVAGCAYFAIAGWFNPMQFTVLAGDDLRSFTAAQKGFHALSNLLASVYRFRPAAAAAISAVVWWTGADYRAAAQIGVFIHAFNALLFLFLFHHVIRLPAILSFGLTTIAILNRFVTYLYIQEEAITEGLAVAALLGIIILTIQFIERPNLFRAMGVGLLYLVIIHLHERYLVMAAPLCLVPLCRFRSARIPSASLLCLVVGATLFNLAVKKLLLSTPILVGTTTHAIELNISQIGSFVWEGAQSLLGINRGPPYLSLEDFSRSPRWVRLISLATAGLSVGLIVEGLRSASWKRRDLLGRDSLTIGCLLLSTGLLLLAASVTIRQEFRWLYSAYVTFLVLLAFLHTSKAVVGWAYPALVGLIILSMAREVYLSRWQSRYFGFEADRTANELYQAVKHIGVEGTESITIVGSVPASKWLFMGNEFSEMYRLPPLEVVPEGAALEKGDRPRLLLKYNTSEQSFELAVPAVSGEEPSHRDDISTLRLVAKGLPVEPELDNPGKKRIFPMQEKGVPCMVAVAPVRLSIDVPSRAHLLHVNFSHVYPLGDGTNLELIAFSAAEKSTLLAKAVPPLHRTTTPYWRRYDLNLPANVKRIELRVFPGEGNASADWLAFRDFSFD
jgi:hypothetical protein